MKKPPETTVLRAATSLGISGDVVEQFAEGPEKRLALLRPKLVITLVYESVLLLVAGAAGDLPKATLGICLPDGIGLCISTKNRHPARAEDGSEMYFVPLEQTPTVLLRLLVPHLESLLDSLRQHIES